MSDEHLILFDIDGTLLSAGRSGYFALEQAAIEVLGATRGLEGIRLDGNTDTNALHQISARDKTPFPSSERIERFKQRYVEILTREIIDKGHLKPGVPNLLERLANHPGVTLALVTGNFREGADIKLKRFGLEGYFPFGAFGCDHHERSELVRMAMHRAAERRQGRPYHANEVVMVGDTVNDVKASLPWGIRSLAVATGSVGREELATAGASLAVDDLSETDRILAWMIQGKR